MKNFILLFVFAWIYQLQAVAQTTKNNCYKLWYTKPATQWMLQALPIGNGSIGAMIFGGVGKEHLQFNEKSLWSGRQSDFIFETIPQENGKDVFEIESRNGKIVPRGNDGVSLALAFNTYLYDDPANFGPLQFNESLLRSISGRGQAKHYAAQEKPQPTFFSTQILKQPGAGPFSSRSPYQNQHIADFIRRNYVYTYSVVFLGDSLIEGWNNLKQAFPKLRVANRGISRDTSRDMLCCLQNTVIDLNPQAVVILGGINDLRATNNPPGTPESIATNYKLILTEIQRHNPKTPVLVCEILPSGIAPAETIIAANKAVDQVVAGFPNAVRLKTYAPFLSPDGSQNKALFTDTVHLTPAGYAVLQSILAPELEKLDLKRVNTAVIPATQPSNGYIWIDRHNAVLKIKAELNPDLVFIGNSITHAWGGAPEGKPKTGEAVLKKAFAGHRILNLGFGSDRTQQVLWRLDNGELEGLKPKWVVINIGTNNTSDGNTAEEIMDGIKAVCERVKKQTPDAKIILMAIFPREASPTCPRRKLINEINVKIAEYAKANGFDNPDIGAKFLDAEGNIQKALMPDYCHPVAKGYEFWAEVIKPLLSN
jgi:lysophospholipase L1-like esterase